MLESKAIELFKAYVTTGTMLEYLSKQLEPNGYTWYYAGYSFSTESFAKDILKCNVADIEEGGKNYVARQGDWVLCKK